MIDALVAVVGSRGTVVMPAFTWGRYHAAERVVFDMAGDDVRQEVGLIAEIFRRRPGVRRSLHVCHSVTAIGPQADAVMGDGVNAFGRGSTFEALYKLAAVCLLLGVGFNACTALHAAEEIVQVPYRYYRDFKGSVVVRPDGSRIRCPSREYLRTAGYRNDLAKMHAVLEREGALRTTRIGAAAVIHARIRDIIDIALRRLGEDIMFLLA